MFVGKISHGAPFIALMACCSAVGVYTLSHPGLHWAFLHTEAMYVFSSLRHAGGLKGKTIGVLGFCTVTRERMLFHGVGVRVRV